MTVAELERKGEFDDYDKIQEILRKFKNAITYDSDPRHAVSLIRTLFLEHVKSSCDINLFFYCISVIKNNLISHYSGADIANRFTDFSVNDFLFSSIEEQCEKLCGILVDLSSQYVNPSSMNHPSIYQAISYIRENYSEDLTVARIAEKVHMNSVYFGRLFKNKTGFTVNQYLMRCRIHAAMRCLKSTSKSVSEISQMVGFRDLQYFSNTFRRQTGYSPLQYRSSQSPQASLAFVDEEG
jgi:YesN/AraC family two-component response regulator